MLVENLADEIASVEEDLHVNPDISLGDAGAAVKDFCGGTQVDPSVRRGDTNHAPISNATETNVLLRSVELEGGWYSAFIGNYVFGWCSSFRW
jgi:hypothetical protein